MSTDKVIEMMELESKMINDQKKDKVLFGPCVPLVPFEKNTTGGSGGSETACPCNSYI